jgi:hypothetical protein
VHIIYLKIELPLYLIKHRAIKVYGGVEVWFQALLASAIARQNRFTPRLFYPGGMSSRYLLHRRLVKLYGRFELCGEKKNLRPCCKSNPSSQVVQPSVRTN